jgi:hypothetical protein
MRGGAGAHLRAMCDCQDGRHQASRELQPPAWARLPQRDARQPVRPRGQLPPRAQPRHPGADAPLPRGRAARRRRGGGVGQRHAHGRVLARGRHGRGPRHGLRWPAGVGREQARRHAAEADGSVTAGNPRSVSRKAWTGRQLRLVPRARGGVARVRPLQPPGSRQQAGLPGQSQNLLGRRLTVHCRGFHALSWHGGGSASIHTRMHSNWSATWAGSAEIQISACVTRHGLHLPRSRSVAILDARVRVQETPTQGGCRPPTLLATAPLIMSLCLTGEVQIGSERVTLSLTACINTKRQPVPSRRQATLRWTLEITVQQMCAEMMASDSFWPKRNALLKPNGYSISVNSE